MMRKRILYIIDELMIGGAERWLINTLSYLDRDRFDPMVCCLGGRRADLVPEVENLGVKVLRAGLRRRIAPITFTRVIKMCLHYRPCIVHTCLWYADFYGRLAARITRVPVIVANVQNTYPWRTPMLWGIDRWQAHSTDRIIACSRLVKEYTISASRIPEQKFTVIYNAVDLQKYPQIEDPFPYKARLGIDGATPTVGMVAMLKEQKGPAYFLRAMHQVHQHLPQALGLFIGDGHLRRALEEEAVDLGLQGCVRFLGCRSDVKEVIAACDVIVAPALWEGTSLSLLQVMAVGRPVVASAVHGNIEVVVSGETGILFPPRDVAALAQGIQTLLQRPDERRRMGQAARRRVEASFSAEKLTKNLEDLYTELLRAKGWPDV